MTRKEEYFEWLLGLGQMSLPLLIVTPSNTSPQNSVSGCYEITVAI